MAKGNWRNWEGRNGAVSSKDTKVPTRPAECPWCGWKWNTRVPVDPVCPKCNLAEHTAQMILAKPGEKYWLRHKTMAMKGKYKR